ncbi:Zinc finger MYND-type [Penicillium concentricum]|uniref:Zinc finger MYND-type n=1 Tax=Penicillium concentricum TaxID=293559 RepID=A0A9W9VL47_9EURO|nr:Zinc finger MYND-type [Penicillium concentricum]KAJ5383801.1 Zinc finger MYND-type [Penicillium concentricum]
MECHAPGTIARYRNLEVSTAALTTTLSFFPAHLPSSSTTHFPLIDPSPSRLTGLSTLGVFKSDKDTDILSELPDLLHINRKQWRYTPDELVLQSEKLPPPESPEYAALLKQEVIPYVRQKPARDGLGWRDREGLWTSTTEFSLNKNDAP